MIELKPTTIALLQLELKNIPDIFTPPYPSTYHGIAVLREEYQELEKEIFWGEKECFIEVAAKRPEIMFFPSDKIKAEIYEDAKTMHKAKIRAEAVQVAAVAIRIIQELT